MYKHKILLDTDIGDDIDDAMTLALAMEMPEVELIGVTTVFLDTGKRARIAKKMLSLWGADIPVYAGIRQAGVGTLTIDDTPCQYTPDLEGGAYEPLNDVYADNGAAAVDFIIRSAETYGDELTIVAIGALTNIAAALEKAPESMKKVKQIVLMGGCFYSQFQEWNILCDPPAAKKVFAFDGRVVCIGLDVTRQAQVTQCQFMQMLDAALDERRAYLISLIKRHNAYTRYLPTLHDPMTLYTVIHPEIVLLEPVLAAVETEGKFSRGMTLNLDVMNSYLSYRLKGRRVLAAKDVRGRDFVEEFMRIVFHIDCGI